MNESGSASGGGAMHGTSVGDLAEGELLERIFPRLPHAEAELLGPGDDAAVVQAPDGRFVVTTDTMIHGPDFRLAWSTGHDLGWKAAASNLADVAAMGARPTALVVALAMPKHLPVAVLDGFAEGLRDACSALAPGCGVVGGDLAVSDVFMIAVTAFGDLEGRAPVRRDGAQVGDTVAVAGELGAAAAGLRLLFDRGVDEAGVPSAEAAAALRVEHRALVEAQLAPRPPIGAGVVAAVGGATAMLDLSDGLALDAGRLARASGVAIDLRGDALGADAVLALSGGEDHALLATFPAAGGVPDGFRAIGTVRSGAGVLVDGRLYDGDAGWDPYRDWDDAAG
ncbi:thiamine-monophosphate kinase [Plantibacter sp. Leaf171]|uniref:thiamine-phosphate kinase n=1 Tax=unclassified Plantibacter TaxID=2624265 RepID=UPI000701C3E8|nr:MULTISPECIES: thiamine-phosphate kinase [unclassified Plantibacter]KQM15456.1 thiamine-monophosphate kinase [Plantibacter sp. Leaf1]KQR58600.1 thiamine-monophosphate kinase [Plantibacter sp. Leaf171]